MAGGGEPYQFAPNATFTGTMFVKKVAGGLEIGGSMSQDGKVLSTFSTVDKDSDVNNFGQLAFHVNSQTFGSSNEKKVADNGITFTNVKLEVTE